MLPDVVVADVGAAADIVDDFVVVVDDDVAAAVVVDAEEGGSEGACSRPRSAENEEGLGPRYDSDSAFLRRNLKIFSHKIELLSLL